LGDSKAVRYGITPPIGPVADARRIRALNVLLAVKLSEVTEV
jgi:hypothetical protein